MSRVAIVGRDPDTLQAILRRVPIKTFEALGGRCHPSDHGELYRGLPSDCVASVFSPYMLEHFGAQLVWCVDVRGDGLSFAARLSDHPDWARFATELSTGEFWSSVGESWVIESGSRISGHHIVDVVCESASTTITG